MLFSRKENYLPVLDGGPLLQELVVDMYIVVVRGRLDFIWNHQLQLQADKYQRLLKILENKTPPKGK
jgi:hypothetical protein